MHETEPQEELRWVPLHPGDAATTVATEGAEEGARQSDGSDGQSREFSWEGVEGLAATRDLCVTGPAFELALADEDPAIGRYVKNTTYEFAFFVFRSPAVGGLAWLLPWLRNVRTDSSSNG